MAAPVPAAAWNVSGLSAEEKDHYHKLRVQELLAAAAAADNTTLQIQCAIDFAYCGSASCTRHTPKFGGVEIAACACAPIRASEAKPAYVQFTTYGSEYLSQNAAYVEMLEEYLTGAWSVETLTTNLCGAINDGQLYTDLRPDRISLPTVTSANTLSGDKQNLVTTKDCQLNLSTASCDGAPCFNNPKAPKDELNVTCLCPVAPAGWSHLAMQMTPPDIGHATCEYYAQTKNDCALQMTYFGLEGDEMREFAVAAVKSMATAKRDTQTYRCRDWFYVAAAGRRRRRRR